MTRQKARKKQDTTPEPTYDATSTDGRRGLVLVDVTLAGVSDVQFDRFISMDGEDHPPEAKMYARKDGTIYIPSANILAMFYSEKYMSCIKMFGKGKKTLAQEAKALISISPNEIVFERNEKSIVFTSFDKDEECKSANVFVHHDVARVLKGTTSIPCPKARPTLRRPWELRFELGVYQMDSREISVSRVYRWLVEGGVLIGIGNHRPMFGKFRVVGFDVKD